MGNGSFCLVCMNCFGDYLFVCGAQGIVIPAAGTIGNGELIECGCSVFVFAFFISYNDFRIPSSL